MPPRNEPQKLSSLKTISLSGKQAESILYSLIENEEGLMETISHQRTVIETQKKKLEELELSLQETRDLIKQLTPNRRRGEIIARPINYKSGFTWEEKIDFVLKQATGALKKGEIIATIKTYDVEVARKLEDDIIAAVSPVLSEMCKSKKVTRYKNSNERGFYYVHSSNTSVRAILITQMEEIED